jgi:uncharacterized protein (TIGR04255 family)
MPFPESPRVIYGRNPLVEVICQLRFPAILAISAEPPAKFQEAIRERYPVLQIRQPNPLAGLGQVSLPQELMGLLSGLPGTASTYDFASDDGNWKVTLSQASIALTATAYERWEAFKEHLQPAVEALENTYRPAFYTRIGLRYRNVIKRSRVGLDGVPWKDLLERPILGVLGTDLATDTHHQASDNIIALGEIGQVRLRHGLGSEGNEPCYVIDADFNVEKRTETRDATKALDALNQQSGRLFRWCVSERLHLAMDPAIAQ